MYIYIHGYVSMHTTYNMYVYRLTTDAINCSKVQCLTLTGKKTPSQPGCSLNLLTTAFVACSAVMPFNLL